MSSQPNKELTDIIRRLKFRNTLVSRTLRLLVWNTGTPEAVLFGPTPSALLNDYFHFCVSRGTRSLLAARLLYDRGHREDSVALVRSAYEAYLRCSAAWEQAHDDHVWDLTVGTLRNSFGIEGRLPPPRISDLATHTRESKLDHPIHRWLYPQLCAFAHPDFRLIGEFQRPEYASYSADCRPGEHLFALCASVYVGCLLLGEISCFEDLDPPEIDSVDRCLSQAAKLAQRFAAFAGDCICGPQLDASPEVTKVPFYDAEQFERMAERIGRAHDTFLEAEAE